MRSCISISILMLASLFSSQTIAATPADKITHYTLSVAGANDEWTSTSIKVSPGDILLVRAVGSVTVGAFLGATGPDGTDNAIGQLQMKIGATSVQAVGSVRYVIVKDAGTAKLRVHDTNYQDNSGEYSVKIIHIPASLIPDAKQVVTD